MALPELKSPVARAVVPVIAGAALIAALGGFLWLIALYASTNPNQTTDNLTTPEWTVGSVDNLAATIDGNGPLLFRHPGSDTNDRSIVIDHEGDVTTDGWRVYWAYPADRDTSCALTQTEGEATFVDCDGRTISVEQLAPPDDGVFPRVDDDTTLVIDFRAATSKSTASEGQES